MELDELRTVLLATPQCGEETPFGPDTLVYKVGGKMFAAIGLEWIPARVNLKCDPERATALRERYPDAVLPGYHMNKRHWNTVLLEGVPEGLLLELVEHSWQLVVAGLSSKQRGALGLDGSRTESGS